MEPLEPFDSPPRISVVIAHLNEPENLRACLASLSIQHADGVPFEIVVVDNGSREMPAAVCADFANVRLERETTPGPGPARNFGAAVARGEIIAFIDSDCTADPGWLAGIAQYFDGPAPADVIGGAVRIAPRDPGTLTVVEAFESVYGYRMKMFIERQGFVATCNMALRREVFTAVGPFEGIAFAEDVEWGHRATSMGYRMVYLPRLGVHTPARESFAELARKWDRHVVHAYTLLPAGLSGSLKWLLRTGIVALSPLGEIPEIATTDLLSGPGPRLKCFAGTARIRLYRARKMLYLAFGGDPSALASAWRRS